MGITSLKPKPQDNFLLILIPYHQLLLETKELIIKIKFNITLMTKKLALKITEEKLMTSGHYLNMNQN